MIWTVVTGIMLPFIGTALGSGTVFFMKKNSRADFTDCLAGFAAGVMLAASVWSLIIPALERSEKLGRFSFIPVCVGFAAGIIFMIFSEKIVDKLSFVDSYSDIKKSLITAFAVTVHNIPEGLAVGMVYAALLTEGAAESLAGALSLSIGIAVQNIPEGAIVSMPVFSENTGKMKAFVCGALSGVVEPLAAVVAIFCVSFFTPLMAYFLSFAAGAMIFVVMNELSEQMKEKKGRGILFFMFGFVVMMAMDVAL